MDEADRIRCVAVDDHPVVRQGLTALLGGAEGIDLVDSVSSGEAMLEAIGAHQPSAAIVDVRLPGIDGILTVRRIAEQAPDVKSVVFSAYGDKRLLSDAIAAGARGYVMKGSDPQDLIRALRAASAGDAFIDPSLAPALVMAESGAEGELSEREREVLQLLADGLHTDQVAERIGLSAETVKSATKRATNKLKAAGRVHAVATALRHGAIV